MCAHPLHAIFLAVLARAFRHTTTAVLTFCEAVHIVVLLIYMAHSRGLRRALGGSHLQFTRALYFAKPQTLNLEP